jgi:alkaline phosphatase
VILFIVDGLGSAQIDLGRGVNGDRLFLDQARWDAKGTLDSSSLDGVTDSAAGGTGLASGVETLNGWLGMVPTVGGGAAIAETVLERAEDRGKSTGLISDSYITDATPGAFAAHVTSRSDIQEIARQMADQGIEFLMGGGLGQGGVEPLLDDTSVTYVWSKAEMDSYVAAGGDGPVFGFFDSWNMVYNLDRDDEGVAGKDPTLPEMTAAALATLSRDSDGFFLMVEAGLVDWAGHARDGASLASEMIEADQALQVARDWAQSRSDTLILLTGDHETGDLGVSAKTDFTALQRQTATTEFMWSRIQAGAPIRSTVATYTGLSLKAGEVQTIVSCGEHGISDVLAARWKLTWNGTCTEEGEHTLVPVPLFAWGPRAGDFAGTFYDNERVGTNLLSYFAP